jgi:hypothetical protein
MPGFNIPPFQAPSTSCDPDIKIFEEESAYQGPAFDTETARKHRFRLEILEPFGPNTGSGSGILLFMEKCTRPTPEVDEITIHNAQDEIYRPGKQRWNPVEFTFYEKTYGSAVQTDEAAERIYKWWGEVMINLVIGDHGNVSDYYKNAQLQMLDGVGEPIWTYYLFDCWPQKVTPIELSYSDSDIATITVTLRFNKCEERRA